MRILVKYPTRSRPELFLTRLKEYISKASDNSSIQYIVSCDEDDVTMTKEVIEAAKSMHTNVSIYSGKGVSKIEACNRDIEKANDWDIILLISDDMHVKINGWDSRIREDFKGFNGCVWYWDKAQKSICTLSCMHHDYYEIDGYLYHPSYDSFFCDNEYTLVAQNRNKMKFIGIPMIQHVHPGWDASVPSDKLYDRNNISWDKDLNNFNKRQANGFN